MMNLKRYFVLLSLALLGLGIMPGRVRSQVTAEAVPNRTGTVVTPNAQNLNQLDITAGTQAGGNLFHSFKDFGLTKDQVANFVSNATIQNILARVNGGNPSIVNGKIQVSGGNANLYLMNPAGILFGSGASLNIPGSFVATTANGVRFGANGWFSAVGANSYGALTGNPDAFAFTMANPGAIVNSANLKSNGDLGLVAGTIVNKGNLTANGNIILTTVPGQRVVRLSQPGSLLGLELQNLPSGGLPLAIADIPTRITGGAEVGSATKLEKDASGKIVLSGAGVDLNAGDIVASGVSKAGNNVQIKPSTGNIRNTDGLVVLAGGDVEFSGNYTGASLSALASGSVTLGNVSIQNMAKPENAISEKNTELGGLAKITRANGDPAKINLTPVEKNGDIEREGGYPVVIDGSNTKTLDVRAGIDWSRINLPSLRTLFEPSVSSANITIGNIGSYYVLLTSQYFPIQKETVGEISIGNAGSQNLFIDSRSNVIMKDFSDFRANVAIFAETKIATGRIEASTSNNPYATSVVLQTRTGNIEVNGIISTGGFGLDIRAGGLFQILQSSDGGYSQPLTPRVSSEPSEQQDADVQLGNFLRDKKLATEPFPLVNLRRQVSYSILARPTVVTVSSGITFRPQDQPLAGNMELNQLNAPIRLEYQGGERIIANQRFAVSSGNSSLPPIESRKNDPNATVGRIIIRGGKAALYVGSTEEIVKGEGENAFVVYDRSATANGGFDSNAPVKAITAEDLKLNPQNPRSIPIDLTQNQKGVSGFKLPNDASGTQGSILLITGFNTVGSGGMAGVYAVAIAPPKPPEPPKPPKALKPPELPKSFEQDTKRDDACKTKIASPGGATNQPNQANTSSQPKSPCKKQNSQNAPILKVEGISPSLAPTTTH